MKIDAPGKNIPKRSLTLKRPRRQPERSVDEIYRTGRERHTQKKFVPAAMNFSLETGSRWKAPAARARSGGGTGRVQRRSPSTLQLNRSNVKRKPSARGRTR